jgi:hypothetical protein
MGFKVRSLPGLTGRLPAPAGGRVGVIDKARRDVPPDGASFRHRISAIVRLR